MEVLLSINKNIINIVYIYQEKKTRKGNDHRRNMGFSRKERTVKFFSIKKDIGKC